MPLLDVQTSLPIQGEQLDEDRRKFLGRCLIFASPIIAGVWGISLRELAISGFVSLDPGWLVLLNAIVAVCGSSAGVCLLHGRLVVKILGSLAYGFLSLLIYGIVIKNYFDLRY